MEKVYHSIDELTSYMTIKYSAKTYTNLKDAIKNLPKLFYCNDVFHLTNSLIDDNDNYLCYVFQKKEKMFLIASFYDNNIVREIFISDEFEYDFKKDELEQIFSFIPFHEKTKEDVSFKFNSYIKKYHNKYDEENVKKIFQDLFNATIIQDENVLKNQPFYKNIVGYNKKLSKSGLTNDDKTENLIFYLSGEKIFIPKDEDRCYVIVSFSNHKVIGIACGFNRFKFRYNLEDLIDTNEALKLLTND